MVQQPSLCSVGCKLDYLIHNSLVKAPFYLPSICTLSQVKHSLSVRWLATHPLSPLRRSRSTLQHSQQTLPPRKQVRGSPQTTLCVPVLWHSRCSARKASLLPCVTQPPCATAWVFQLWVCLSRNAAGRTVLLAAQHSFEGHTSSFSLEGPACPAGTDLPFSHNCPRCC